MGESKDCFGSGSVFPCISSDGADGMDHRIKDGDGNEGQGGGDQKAGDSVKQSQFQEKTHSEDQKLIHQKGGCGAKGGREKPSRSNACRKIVIKTAKTVIKGTQ